MTEVMAKLQQANLIDQDEDFLVITSEDLEASLVENRNSCFGKIMVEREPNIQNIRRCLRHAWMGMNLGFVKLVRVCTNFSFLKKKELFEFVLFNGPWHIKE